MKKQYIAALACLVAGAIGLAGAYSTNSSKEQAEEEPILESSSIQKYQSADEIKENAVNNADVDEAASMVGREADSAINQAADSTKQQRMPQTNPGTARAMSRMMARQRRRRQRPLWRLNQRHRWMDCLLTRQAS